MTGYAELVKALRFETDYVAVEKTMRDAAAAIEVLQAKVPHWVRCDEALPEIGQRVIVYDGWMQFMTRKDDQLFNGKMYWENEEGNWERVDYEAYWMPIEPPQEEK